MFGKELLFLIGTVGWLPEGVGFMGICSVPKWSRTCLKNNLQEADDWDSRYRTLQEIQDKQIQSALIDSLILPDASAPPLVAIYLRGKGTLPVATVQAGQKNVTRPILVLTRETENEEADVVASSLIVPLEDRNQLKLVSIVKADEPLSKSVLLGLNSLLVNRDNALFDNLPWSTWSVDPQLRNRDAAGNSIDPKFHLGKRDAYNRFMGKDWQGRSIGIGNLALRLKYMLEDEGAATKEEDDEDTATREVLAQRILQLEIRELQMDLAQVDSDLAIVRNNNKGSVSKFEKDRLELEQKIKDAQDNLTKISKGTKAQPSVTSEVLDKISQWSTADGKNAAPYRGATGYAPMLDSKDDVVNSHLPYNSPYHLLREILEDQLNAKVIGCILENTSLLRGNLAVGGAVILQRITPTKIATIMGETVSTVMPEEDYGNEGLTGGETMVVECEADEAIGIAVALNVPMKVESDLFNKASVLAKQVTNPLRRAEKAGRSNAWEVMPTWRPVEMDATLEIEGEKPSATKSNPIAIPRTTSSLDFVSTSSDSNQTPLFPSDNPIKSLDEYDYLTTEDKAKTLLELSNFKGRLPRPRVVRSSKVNPLDQLLVPLIDESVRRQFLIREAEQNGDMERVAKLKSSTSKRQMAKENAASARESGNENEAERWETEADFLASLRADVTQDEGSYNRFLDRDEWYERDRQATARRIKKSSFGTLLDGIE